MKLFLSTLIILFSLLLISSPIHAKTQELILSGTESDMVLLKPEEVVDKDYIGFGKTVQVSGIVNGDVYAFGGNIIIDGVVNGDVIVVAGSVSIPGDVRNNVRVFAGQGTIRGTVGKNVTLIGGSFEISPGANVSGNIVATTGSLRIDAPIEGGAKVGAGNIIVNSSIGKDLEIGGGNIHLTDQARVNGNFLYHSDKEPIIDENVRIAGQVVRAPDAPGYAFTKPAKPERGFFSVFHVAGFLSSFLIGAVLLYFFPKYSHDVKHTLKNKPLASLGMGMVECILLPLLLVLLVASIIGIPLALILFVLFILAVYISKVFVSLWLADLIFSKANIRAQEVWVLFVGLLFYMILGSVPVVGGILRIALVFMGLGAMFFTKREYIRSAKHTFKKAIDK